MSPLQTAELVTSIASLGVEGAKAVQSWLKDGGERPDAVLADLPDFTRNHLDMAALELRAAGTPTG